LLGWLEWRKASNNNNYFITLHYFKSPLGRPRCRWVDNTKMDLQATGWGVDWIGVAQDRDKLTDRVEAVMNFLVQ